MIIVILIIVLLEMVNCYNVINIGSTGLLMPYSIGILGYMKKYKVLENCKFIGTSGGAWCSILYNLEKDLSNHDKIWSILLENTNEIIYDNMHECQIKAKNNLIEKYKNINFNDDIVKKTSIGINVINVNYIYPEKKLITNFTDIEDLINICYASSYIPLISGKKLYYKYNNNRYVDGGIFDSTQIIDDPNILNIHYSMWGRNFEKYNGVSPISGTKINKKLSYELYNYGWEDAEKNIKSILNNKNIIE